MNHILSLLWEKKNSARKDNAITTLRDEISRSLFCNLLGTLGLLLFYLLLQMIVNVWFYEQPPANLMIYVFSGMVYFGITISCFYMKAASYEEIKTTVFCLGRSCFILCVVMVLCGGACILLIGKGTAAINRLVRVFSGHSALFTAMGLMLLCSLIQCRRLVHNVELRVKKQYLLLGNLLGLLILLFMIYVDFHPLNIWATNVSNDFMHKNAVCVAVICTACFTGSNWLCLNKQNTDKGRIIMLCWFVLAGMVFSAIAMYYPNSEGITQHHFDAVYGGIYNAYYGAPIRDATGSIYGHYALFFLPVLRILGTVSPYVVVRIFACMAGLSSFLFSMSVSYATKDKRLQFLAPIVFFIVKVNGVYLQLYPLRMLTVVLTLFYLVYPNKTRRWCIWGEVLSCFLLLWTTDFGILCAFIIKCYRILEKMRSALHVPELLRYGICQMLLFIAEIGIAIAAVNIYNFSRGYSEIEIVSFFFPLNTTYDVEYPILTGRVPVIVCAFIWIEILYMAVFSDRFIRLLKGNAEPSCTVDMSLALLGLAVFVYYINRPAYGNLRATVLPFILLLMVCYSEIQQSEKVYCQIASGVLAFCISFMAVFSIAQQVNNTVERMGQNHDVLYGSQSECDRAAIRELEKIPEDTFVFGTEVRRLYGLMGKNCGSYIDPIHYVVSEKSKEEVRGEMSRAKHVLIQSVNEEGLADVLCDMTLLRVIPLDEKSNELHLYGR